MTDVHIKRRQKKNKPQPVTPVEDKAASPDTVLGKLGAPTGEVSGNFRIVGDGIQWSRVNRWDAITLAAATKHKVDPAWLKGMQVVESGGEMVWNRNGSGAYGIMQVKPSIWDAAAKKLRYDLMTPEGNIGFAAAMLGGDVPGLRGSTVEERFLENYYPVRDAQGKLCLDCKGEDGSTPNDYLHDLRLLKKQIDAAAGIDGGATPAPVDPWRPYPYPKMVDVLVPKPGEGAGFDRVAFRRPRIVGSCNHITDGDASIEWYRDFFATGGERAWDALTDTVIGRDGRIGLLNDWRDPNRGGTRAGWANGTANGIEGDGQAFYRKYPLINDVLVSKEHVGRSGQAMTDAQMAASIELSTAVAQESQCPWDTYPYHPGKGGVNIEMMHYLFAPKACPAQPFIGTYYPILVREVKAALKAWQGGAGGGTGPVEPEPVWYTRFGFSLHDIETFFGRITRYNRDGTTDEFPFDTKGALSLLWLNRCDAEGKFPEAERIWFSDAKFVDGEEMWASWVGGWTAYLPLAESRASWQWLDAKKE